MHPTTPSTNRNPLRTLARASVIGLALLVSMATSMQAAPVEGAARAEAVTVTILSSNLADGATVGEWGFSALVVVDGRCVLFDAGRYPDTVLRNAEVLDLDLSCATDVVLSHFHFDHTGGLLRLLEDLRPKNPDALRRIHVAKGFFLPRRIPEVTGDEEFNRMIAARSTLEAAGVEFVEYTEPTEISPAVWITGPIERRHQEKTWSKEVRVEVEGEWREDWVPDSQGLAIATADGPIVLLGCGHSGSVNLLEQVHRSIQGDEIQALMGGMHLYAADDETLEWTAARLRELGLHYLMAGHCTGIEPLMRLRQGLGLSRETAVVGAVGSQFVYGEGIRPTSIAQ